MRAFDGPHPRAEFDTKAADITAICPRADGKCLVAAGTQVSLFDPAAEQYAPAFGWVNFRVTRLGHVPSAADPERFVYAGSDNGLWQSNDGGSN